MVESKDWGLSVLFIDEYVIFSIKYDRVCPILIYSGGILCELYQNDHDMIYLRGYFSLLAFYGKIVEFIGIKSTPITSALFQVQSMEGNFAFCNIRLFNNGQNGQCASH